MSIKASDESKAKTSAQLLEAATDQTKTEFDYIIVGSGAGGGPLACRLALAGKRVLLIESGGDPAKAPSLDFPTAEQGEIHDGPGYMAAASEDKEMSWQFSVRHYADTKRQQRDQKYEPKNDPGEQATKETAKDFKSGGIFYPRSSGLGGCTGHHAMIVIRPNDQDWDHIADLTNDDSWSSSNMQPLFAKFENCLYTKESRGVVPVVLDNLFLAWRAIVKFFNPRAILDEGGHGGEGWQPTSFISADLIKRVLKTDPIFTKVLLRSAFTAIEGSNRVTAWLKQLVVTFGVVRSFDPNDNLTRQRNPNGGVYLIPMGTGGEGELKDEQGHPLKGRRAGVREFILKTARSHPDKLVIESNVHVTQVLFQELPEAEKATESKKGSESKGTTASEESQKPKKPVPRAIGVEAVKGEHLYEASPLYKLEGTKGKRVNYYAKGEVILSGGTFNTPQLLMLSGIGDPDALRGLKNPEGGTTSIDCRVSLPGVGRNLQDRYEVGLVSELKGNLNILKDVSFQPGDAKDPELKLWRDTKEGLYAINGGTLVVLKRTKQADEPVPDVFTFGAPAAFRGYYWNWSREIFRPTKGAPIDQKNLWTWVILKAYTRNNGGRVELFSNSPFETPKICFHSFDEGESANCTGDPVKHCFDDRLKEWYKDVDALVEAIESLRRVNHARHSLFGKEIQPKGYLDKRNEGLPREMQWSLKDWIMAEAWGHHACGTCRIGSDPWREAPEQLDDKYAVIDSRFRVHGVKGLRIVDASVFPRIPGYFILAPIFMVSEKAALTILEDDARESDTPEGRARWCDEHEAALAEMKSTAASEEPSPREEEVADNPTDSFDVLYPEKIRAIEFKALCKRRKMAHLTNGLDNITGLALSGGGIRSAIFNLGLLQGLAKKDKLREIDYLSTVSGGSFIGGFLGRLYLRDRVKKSSDPCGRIQKVIQSNQSIPIRWLRENSNYLFATGANDKYYAIGLYFQNSFAVQLVIGIFFFMVFGALAGISRLGSIAPHLPRIDELPGISYFISPDSQVVEHLSVWWWVPLAVLVVVVVPMSMASWLSPKEGSYRGYAPYALAVWLLLFATACLAFRWSDYDFLAGVLLVMVAMSSVWQEIVRWKFPDETVTERRYAGNLIRNRLSRGLGVSLVIFVALLIWVAIDSLARLALTVTEVSHVVRWFVPAAPFLLMFRSWAEKLLKEKVGAKGSIAICTIAVVLALVLLLIADMLAQRAFDYLAWPWAWVCVLLAFLFSVVVGRAIDFLNYSSLHTAYAARITRCFLGATNDGRYDDEHRVLTDVQITHFDDDVAQHLYKPEEQGGPLHLLSVCINDTVEPTTERVLPERKGTLMTIGSFGVSVGRRYFATWTPKIVPPGWLRRRRTIEGFEPTGADPPALKAIPLNPDPNTFHPLGRRDRLPAVVESLSLGSWIAISGAAFSTGRGLATKPLESLFLGLVNLRLGYWWSSGIYSTERPGRFPANFWRRLQDLPGHLFRTQSILLSEWRGLFYGPSRELWNLTDGGHVDNSAVYELVRRRLPLIICSDATRDPGYIFEDFAELVRNIRIDFGAELEWKSPAELAATVKKWVDPAACGSLDEIKGNPSHGGPGTKHAAVATITYPDGRSSCLIFIKASLTKLESVDLTEYAASDKEFPQDSTDNQFYDESQWESYRQLGFAIADRVFR